MLSRGGRSINLTSGVGVASGRARRTVVEVDCCNGVVGYKPSIKCGYCGW